MPTSLVWFPVCRRAGKKCVYRVVSTQCILAGMLLLPDVNFTGVEGWRDWGMSPSPSHSTHAHSVSSEWLGGVILPEGRGRSASHY